MALTHRQLNRATLARQLLLGRERCDVADAVGRVVALQAQDAASPYLALWNRIDAFDPDDLTAAYADHRVLKAPLMRITLHAVRAEDYPAFRRAMISSLRASRVGDRRFRGLGIAVEQADALVPDLLTFLREPRTNAEIDGWVRQRCGELPAPGVWWALRTYGPFVHAPTGGPWSFGPRPAYRSAPAVPLGRHLGGTDQAGDRSGEQAAIRSLIGRYLDGFGPAAIADIAQFTLLRRSVIRDAAATMDDLVAMTGPEGGALLDRPPGPLPDPDTVAPPRLLGMWDNVLLAYADRSRLIPPAYRRHVIKQNGDVLPTVLIDGQVAGIWRPVDGRIEIGAFHPLTEPDWAALEVEAAALHAMLADREPPIYRRFAHWWVKGLPIEQTRRLAG